MTISILSQISALLRPSFSDDLDTVMLWAAFTLAFFGFLRVSEFTYYSPPAGKPFLAVNDANFIPNITHPTSILLTIKQSKTDPFRTISKSHSPVCAVNALREYLLQRNPTNPPRTSIYSKEWRTSYSDSLELESKRIIKTARLCR